MLLELLLQGLQPAGVALGDRFDALDGVGDGGEGAGGGDFFELSHICQLFFKIIFVTITYFVAFCSGTQKEGER